MTPATARSTRDSQTVTPTISYLPVELLQQIFSHFIAFEEPLSAHYAYTACVAVTHVCSRWRAAALNYSPLWTSINTGTMEDRWVKVFLERSNPSFIDLTLDFYHKTDRTKRFLNVDEAIALFTGCMRLHSLQINGNGDLVSELLRKLHVATPICSLSLYVVSTSIRPRPVVLPDNMLGGQVPVPKVRFVTLSSSIFAPRWLLRGITHFTSYQLMSLNSLLDILCQMPALHSFTLEGFVFDTMSHASPQDSQISMPNLMYFTVSVTKKSPTIFAQLLRRLVLPDGAKRSVRLHQSLSHNPKVWSPVILGIPPYVRQVIIEAANGLRHVQLSGGSLNGNFRLWTGDLGYEEAEFSFEFSWGTLETGEGPLYPVIDLAALCDVLGVERVRTLTLRTNSQDFVDSGKSFRQVLLRKMPGAEVVE